MKPSDNTQALPLQLGNTKPNAKILQSDDTVTDDTIDISSDTTAPTNTTANVNDAITAAAVAAVAANANIISGNLQNVGIQSNVENMAVPDETMYVYIYLLLFLLILFILLYIIIQVRLGYRFTRRQTVEKTRSRSYRLF